MRGRAFLIALLAGASLAGAAAAEGDFTGSWDFRGRVEAQRDNSTPPALPAVAAEMARKRSAAKAADNVRSVSNMLCLPTGFPQMMQWKSPIEILQTKGRITILSEHDPGNDEPRTIYMDKPMPGYLDPSWNGYSVGRWEGETLVIETAGLNGRASVFGLPRGETTRITERLHTENGGKLLIDAVTVEDPKTLSKPWTVTLSYDRMPEGTERFEAVCEPDLEALGKADLKAMAAYDATAARMLDPNQAYNPGAR